MSQHPGPSGCTVARRAAGLVVVTALALQACSEDPAPASPAASPTRSGPAYELEPFEPADRDDWLTEVPDGTRIDAALPADGGDFTRNRAGIRFEFCDVEAFSAGEVLDRVAVSVTGPEYGEGRDLRVFADDRTAHQFQRHVLAVLDACTEQEMGATIWRHQVRSSVLEADEAFTVLQTFETDGLMNLGANWWEVVRVGNAILLTATGGEYDPAHLDPGIRRHAREVSGIVDAMCAFAAAPCGG